jgi:casein kinase 1
MKMKLKPAELCKDMPVEFTRYLDLVKSLKFKDRPDYKYF